METPSRAITDSRLPSIKADAPRQPRFRGSSGLRTVPSRTPGPTQQRTDRAVWRGPISTGRPARAARRRVAAMPGAVTQGSTIRIGYNTYSVPSRLIGEKVDVHIKVECLEVSHGAVLVERLPRLRGRNKHEINYRHVIDWLVRKPGAFAGYRYQDAMFPTSRFRRAYDALLERSPGRAARDYLRSSIWRPSNPRPGSMPCWAGSWSGMYQSRRPSSPTIWPTTWACRGRWSHDHNGGFVDVRPITRDQGGHAINRPTDLHKSLKDCLRDLHLPTIRDEYESAAQRARQESSSYERYLLDLTERNVKPDALNGSSGSYANRGCSWRRVCRPWT